MPSYHTYETLLDDINQLRETDPGLDEGGFVDRNVTDMGLIPNTEYRIPLIKVGRNSGHRIFIIGGTHAREWISVEIPFLLAKLLVEVGNNIKVALQYEPFRYQINRLIREREIWIVPMFNPEGHALSRQQGYREWRRNRRFLGNETISLDEEKTWQTIYDEQKINTGVHSWQEIAQANRQMAAAERISLQDPNSVLHAGLSLQLPVYGVDLNRNFPFQWTSRSGLSSDDEVSRLSDRYPGPHAASEYETQAVINIFKRAKRERKPFQAVLSYHNNAEWILYPWAYRNERTNRQTVIDFGKYMAMLINEMRSPDYVAEITEAIRQLSENWRPVQDPEREREIMEFAFEHAQELAQSGVESGQDLEDEFLKRFWSDANQREFYYARHPGLEISGMFLDWAHFFCGGIAVYTIELSLRMSEAIDAIQHHRNSGAPGFPPSQFDVPEDRILPTFLENLPAALALIEHGSYLRRTHRFDLPQIRSKLTAEPIRSNRVFVCHIFPWGRSDDVTLSWMQGEHYVEKIPWGDQVDLVCEINDAEQFQQDTTIEIEIVERDIGRLDDDLLKRLSLPVQSAELLAGNSRFSVPWRVGDIDEEALESGYGDWSGTPEYAFLATVNNRTLRSEEIELLQGIYLFWDVPTPMSDSFALIARCWGIPPELDFTGEFTIDSTLAGRSDRVRFPFDSQNSPHGFQVFRQSDFLELRQQVQLTQLPREEERERRRRPYPFGVVNNSNSDLVTLNLNLTDEAIYNVNLHITVGEETLDAEREDLLIRPFEDIFFEDSALPSMGHYPDNDGGIEQAYRERMVVIPNDLIYRLRQNIQAANNESTDYAWWTDAGRGTRIVRQLRSQQQKMQRLQSFAALSMENTVIRNFINQDFNCDCINKGLSIFHEAEPALSTTLHFFSSETNDTGVALVVEGYDTDRTVREVITLNGSEQIRAQHSYSRIISINIQSGTLHGVLQIEMEDPTLVEGQSNPVYAINVNERKIRYDNSGAMNRFIRYGGSQLAVNTTAAVDRSERKRVRIWGYQNEDLTEMVQEDIAVGETSSTQFFKVVEIFLVDNLEGFISITARHRSDSCTLWRNIFDEDIPESVIESYQRSGVDQLELDVGLRAIHLQKLGDILHQYLGLAKNIRVVTLDNFRLRPARIIAETTNQNDYYLIQFFLNYPHFHLEDTIERIAHECKHAHQYDRVQKMPNWARSVNVRSFERNSDPLDLRIVKAWMLNEGSGYISSNDEENYRLQIREVDANGFARRVFQRLIN